MLTTPADILNRAKGLDAFRVLQLLGVEDGGRRRKRECPSCGSINLYPHSDGAFCYSCDRKWSNIDLALEWSQVSTPLGAAMHLLELDGTGFYLERARRRSNPAKAVCTSIAPNVADDERTGRERGEDYSEWYAMLWAGLELDAEAHAYLESRGLRDTDALFGLSSATASEWSEAVGAFSTENASAMGLINERGNAHPHWQHHIIIPWYRYLPTPENPVGVIDTFRFRCLSGEGRYMFPKGAGPSRPYGECWAGPRAIKRGVLYVVEGEFDALAVHQCGRAAVASGGVGWRREWCEWWGVLEQVVVLADDDIAGMQLVKKVRDSMVEALGLERAKALLRAEKPVADTGKDASDLHRDGMLVKALEAIEKRHG